MFSWDKEIFNILFGITKYSDLINSFFVFLGEGLGYILPIVFLFYFLLASGFKNRFYIFALTTLSVILSRGIIAESLTFFIDSPRPYVFFEIKPLFKPLFVKWVENGSFPSGHMAFFIPLALTVLHINRKAGIWFLFLVFMMGFFRVVCGVHWLSDIFAGIIIGFFSFYLIKSILPKFLKNGLK